jgi:hypothetical protein
MWFPSKLVAAGHNSQNNQLGRYSGGINCARPAGAPISKQFHFASPIQFRDGVARTSRFCMFELLTKIESALRKSGTAPFP